MPAQPESEQQMLPGLSAPRPVPATSETGLALAADLPIARLCVDVAPAHLDRLFDYTVPAALSADAQPGVRVKVRFGAQDVDGYVMERAATTTHTGNLVAIRKVVSPQPVLTPEVADLARRVADYYAGSLSDVLRLAVPPRLARVEKEPTALETRASGLAEADGARVTPPATSTPATSASAVTTSAGDATEEGAAAEADGPAEELGAGPGGLTAWSVYRGGDAFLGRLRAGDSPRAVWTALPGQGRTGGWPAALAQAALATATGGRGTVIVLPDAHDVDRLAQALVEAGVPGWSPQHAAEQPDVPCFVPLTADLGPTPRYRNFLAALRGEAQIVVGTRAAAFAPVTRLGLAVCWDDVDAMHQERRAPYPHVREIVALRAEQTGCAVLVGGLSRSIHAEALVRSGWAREIVADRQTVRTETPRVEALTSVEVAREGPAGAARLPGAAWQAITKGLLDGPVLVQVPRAGYLPVVACVRCRTAARCTACNGPLALHGAHAVPQCSWCGALAGGWRCPECSSTGLRSVRVGSDRTAEELGKAFPGATVRVSGARSASGILSEVPDTPALVVSTPGAEPVAPSGYSVGVLLDAAVSTSHVGLYTDQEALHRWITAGALVRPSRLGGRLLLVGDAAPTPTNALVRWDPSGLAGRELDERAELSMPPAVRIASVTGDRHAVALFLSRVTLPEGGSVLGPVDLPEPAAAAQTERPAPLGRSGRPAVTRAVQPGSGTARSRAGGGLEAEVRAILRVPVARGRDLARHLAAALAVASARREAGLITVVLDPKEML